MNYITGHSRGQITLLLDCIDDLISPDNPCRVIDAFVDGPDIEDCIMNGIIPNAAFKYDKKEKNTEIDDNIIDFQCLFLCDA